MANISSILAYDILFIFLIINSLMIRDVCVFVNRVEKIEFYGWLNMKFSTAFSATVSIDCSKLNAKSVLKLSFESSKSLSSSKLNSILLLDSLILDISNDFSSKNFFSGSAFSCRFTGFKILENLTDFFGLTISIVVVTGSPVDGVSSSLLMLISSVFSTFLLNVGSMTAISGHNPNDTFKSMGTSFCSSRSKFFRSLSTAGIVLINLFRTLKLFNSKLKCINEIAVLILTYNVLLLLIKRSILPPTSDRSYGT
ncbi:hypothetical protein DERP_009597 [Dermatophagoides pteronyssinus]|uniref:Uncharacterized protein n=1 Tax=Dermatophagoides pteronyssinus TaxID=6956 RepID=A0ABQ8JAC3_DERPT|nr:hypothetical protein DERP_009597 [Dermatophagoides pteronyssinus]